MNSIIPERKIVTLCFLLREEEVLLGWKKIGFGKGKWNGIGGKVEAGETVPKAAVREIEEEIHVLVQEEHLEKAAEFLFRYIESGGDTPEMECHVYIVRQWEGEPSESEEIRPLWHNLENVPLHEMWEDDTHWLPRVLSGETIKGTFHFHGQGKKLRNFSIVPFLF